MISVNLYKRGKVETVYGQLNRGLPAYQHMTMYYFALTTTLQFFNSPFAPRVLGDQQTPPRALFVDFPLTHAHLTAPLHTHT